MQAQQLNLNVISNNIANVNTTGYKKNKIEFQDLLYQNPRQAGGQTGAGNVIPTGVEMGNGTKVVSTAKIFTQGQLTQTSEKMDVAVDGVGFFQVERPDGTEAYTRDGAFKVGPDGQITTADALPLAAPHDEANPPTRLCGRLFCAALPHLRASMRAVDHLRAPTGDTG